MKTSFTTLILAFAIVFGLAVPCMAVTLGFKTAYEKSLREIADRPPNKGVEYHDNLIVSEFNTLLRLASRDELGDAIAATLGNPEKKGHWGDAFSLSMMLGPHFDRSNIVSAIRRNLENYFVLDEAKNLGGYGHTVIHLAAYELCYYGTEEDVKLVTSFAAKVAKLNPGLAMSIEFTVFNRTKVLELRAKETNPETKEDQQKPQSLKPPLPNLQVVQPPASKTKQPLLQYDEPFSSTPWSIIIILAIVALSLSLLLLKNRK
jgi:hypothetical protein